MTVIKPRSLTVVEFGGVTLDAADSPSPSPLECVTLRVFVPPKPSPSTLAQSCLLRRRRTSCLSRIQHGGTDIDVGIRQRLREAEADAEA